MKCNNLLEKAVAIGFYMAALSLQLGKGLFGGKRGNNLNTSTCSTKLFYVAYGKCKHFSVSLQVEKNLSELFWPERHCPELSVQTETF